MKTTKAGPNDFFQALNKLTDPKFFNNVKILCNNHTETHEHKREAVLSIMQKFSTYQDPLKQQLPRFLRRLNNTVIASD